MVSPASIDALGSKVDGSNEGPEVQSADIQTSIAPVGLDWSHKEAIAVHARIVGERIGTKEIERTKASGIEQTGAIATNPLIIKAGATGCAVILRYGVIVTFDLSLEEEAALLKTLQPHIREPISQDISETLPLTFRPNAKERLENGTLYLQACSAERLQIVAEALGKSVVLDYYETEVSSLFTRIKPFATAIQGKTRKPPKEEELLELIGGTLLIQQKMVGIVEVGEKPDPIWDYPALDRLYLRLEDEYELRERLISLERKLTLVSTSVETSLNILQRDSSHRVEWYITILIVIEIAIALYDIWTR
ncbi:MAG: RMD1 family protein [Phormidesmis sp.]